MPEWRKLSQKVTYREDDRSSSGPADVGRYFWVMRSACRSCSHPCGHNQSRKYTDQHEPSSSVMYTSLSGTVETVLVEWKRAKKRGSKRCRSHGTSAVSSRKRDW